MFHRTLSTSRLLAAEPVPNFDHRETYHARIEAQGASDGLLNGRRGVEAHDKVVAGVVLRLVFCRRFREEERAPVGDAAYHAARGEDLLAGCASNPSGERGMFLVKNRHKGIGPGKRDRRGRGRSQPYSLTSDRLPGRTCDTRC